MAGGALCNLRLNLTHSQSCCLPSLLFLPSLLASCFSLFPRTQSLLNTEQLLPPVSLVLFFRLVPHFYVFDLFIVSSSLYTACLKVYQQLSENVEGTITEHNEEERESVGPAEKDSDTNGMYGQGVDGKDGEGCGIIKVRQ